MGRAAFVGWFVARVGSRFNHCVCLFVGVLCCIVAVDGDVSAHQMRLLAAVEAKGVRVRNRISRFVRNLKSHNSRQIKAMKANKAMKKVMKAKAVSPAVLAMKAMKK